MGHIALAKIKIIWRDLVLTALLRTECLTVFNGLLGNGRKQS